MKAFLQFWNDCYLNLILPLHNLKPCDEDILEKLFSSFTSETGNREMLKFLPGELVDLGEGDLGLQWISISVLLRKGLVNRLGSAADVTRTMPLACVVWRMTFYCDGPDQWLEGTGLKIDCATKAVQELVTGSPKGGAKLWIRVSKNAGSKAYPSRPGSKLSRAWDPEVQVRGENSRTRIPALTDTDKTYNTTDSCVLVSPLWTGSEPSTGHVAVGTQMLMKGMNSSACL